MKRSVAKLSPAGRNPIDGKELLEGKVPGKRLWKDFLFSAGGWPCGDVADGFGGCCCPCWAGSVDRSKGASRMVVMLGSKNLLLAVGKRGLPGIWVGAWALAGATLVRRTLELRRRLACLALLTPGIPGVFA